MSLPPGRVAVASAYHSRATRHRLPYPTVERLAICGSKAEHVARGNSYVLAVASQLRCDVSWCTHSAVHNNGAFGCESRDTGVKHHHVACFCGGDVGGLDV